MTLSLSPLSPLFTDLPKLRLHKVGNSSYSLPCLIDPTNQKGSSYKVGSSHRLGLIFRVNIGQVYMSTKSKDLLSAGLLQPSVLGLSIQRLQNVHQVRRNDACLQVAIIIPCLRQRVRTLCRLQQTYLTMSHQDPNHPPTILLTSRALPGDHQEKFHVKGDLLFAA